MLRRRTVAIALGSALLATLVGIAWAVAVRSQRAQWLRIATWNMEWLVAPRTAQAARLACREQRRSALPCDVARRLVRDSADLARLAAQVRRLDADVIAFQEVENAAIAARVFRGYRICMASGAGVQHVGFAIRGSLPHRCGPQVEQLAGNARGRAALVLTIEPAGLPAIELLAVHLKSGCATDPLEGDKPACQLLHQQAQALGEWISQRAARQAPFIVVGDFNRAGSPRGDDVFWGLLHPPAFHAAASALAFSNCMFGQPYTAFIDHILVGQSLASRLAPQPFSRFRFAASDAARHRLSDHCPVSVSLQKYVQLLAADSQPNR
ncbi:MAG: endonuclease/exonuclease/phosphatase family protein [Steroidobacteraceae bacterium]